MTLAASATVVAGGDTEVIVDCTDDVAADAGERTLSGTLQIAPSWGEVYVQVLAFPLDRPPLAGEIERTRSRREEWPLDRPAPWRCAGLLPGRYRLWVEGCGLTRDVEVPAQGEAPAVALAAEAPVRGEASFVRAGSGGPAFPSTVWLCRRAPDGVLRFLVRGEYLDDNRRVLVGTPGRYTLLAQVGPHRIEREIDLVAGAVTTVGVPNVAGALLQFRAGTARIPIDQARVRLSAIGHDGRLRYCIDVGVQLSTHVTRPGRYLLELDEPGYRPLCQEIEFTDAWRMLDVQLTRQ